jgi:branched-chain amino acid transport system ATP-binding protein
LRFGAVTALDAVSFTLGGGEVVALVGPNGAGKTSVLNCVSGVARPTNGRVLVDGRDVAGARPDARVRLGMARTLQATAVVDDLSVLANLLLGRDHLGGRTRDHRGRCEAVAAELGLSGHLSSAAARLPTGARKRLELGRALASDGRLLLLDEPFAGAGRDEVEVMAAAIRRSRTAALVVDHDLDALLGLADRVVRLEAGRVVEAQPAPTT